MTSTLYKLTNPPIKNTAFSFSACLFSQSDTKIIKTSPTLAAGDVLVQKDNGGFSNIATLPTSTASGILQIALSASEMNGNQIDVLFKDAAGAEWCDLLITFSTVDLVTVAAVDGTSAPTVAEIDTQLSTTHGAGSWETGSGGGSVIFDYYVYELDGVTGISGVKVTVSSDVTGLNIVATGYTDITGKATFSLDPNTYYFWSTKSGYTFTNPDMEVVS